MQIRLSNDPAEMKKLKPFLDSFKDQHGLDQKSLNNINLAVEEIVANCVEHGFEPGKNHEVLIDLNVDPDNVLIRIEDDGKPFNPCEAAAPDLDADIPSIGGLGIFLTKKVMHDLEYQRADDRNVLTMKHKRSS